MIRLNEQKFESAVFGRVVARLTIDADTPASALADMLEAAPEKWSTRDLWLVACRITRSDESPAMAQSLEAAGFVAVETLVTLERKITPLPTEPDAAQPSRPGDAAPCVEIARTAFTHDRFHADRRIPQTGADELKARWVANSFDGRADTVLVARKTNQHVGFCACLLDEQRATIDLIATDRLAQGQGHGRRLVVGALQAYDGRAETMRVGTQASNERSLALYRGLGFEEVSRADTYHWMSGGST